MINNYVVFAYAFLENHGTWIVIMFTYVLSVGINWPEYLPAELAVIGKSCEMCL